MDATSLSIGGEAVAAVEIEGQERELEAPLLLRTRPGSSGPKGHPLTDFNGDGVDDDDNSTGGGGGGRYASGGACGAGDGGSWVVEDGGARQPECSPTAAVFCMSNTMIGAGLMALPRVFAILGLVGGTAVMGLVYLLAYYSIGAIVRAAELTRGRSYPGMVGMCFGRTGELLLQLAILVNNGGMLVVLISILGDSLSDPASGLLPRLLPQALAASPLCSKPVAELLLVALVLTPLCCLRDMQRLGGASLASLMISFGFGALTAALAAIAACKGQVHGIRLLPEVASLGGTWPSAALACVLTLPVTMLSYVCHYNLLPLKNQLRGGGSQRAMLDVSIRALAITTCLYLAVGCCGYILFGDATSENVLLDYSTHHLARVVGHKAGAAVSVLVQLLFAGVLCLTYPLVNWALRETVQELAFGRQLLTPSGFYSLTGLMQLGVYVIAVVAPSIWMVMELMGATCGVLVAYFFPGLLILRIGPSANKTRRVAAAYAMLALGLALAAIAIAQQLLQKL